MPLTCEGSPSLTEHQLQEKSEQLHERHARSDFETKTQDGGVQDPTPVRIMFLLQIETRGYELVVAALLDILLDAPRHNA